MEDDIEGGGGRRQRRASTDDGSASIEEHAEAEARDHEPLLLRASAAAAAVAAAAHVSTAALMITTATEAQTTLAAARRRCPSISRRCGPSFLNLLRRCRLKLCTRFALAVWLVAFIVLLFCYGFFLSPTSLSVVGLSPFALSSDAAEFFSGFLSRHTVIVSLAASADRLHTELPVTLRSLLAQTVQPTEIRVYAPLGDRPLFEAARRARDARGHGPLTHPLAHASVHLHFVEDAGPATKFIYVLKEFVWAAALFSSSSSSTEPSASTSSSSSSSSSSATPPPFASAPPRALVVVCDNDHWYPPHWLATLVQASVDQPGSSVGLRGWRVNRSLRWGVAPASELDSHVITAWTLTQPYRVSVLTANEGYLLDSAWFETEETLKPIKDEADAMASANAAANAIKAATLAAASSSNSSIVVFPTASVAGAAIVADSWLEGSGSLFQVLAVKSPSSAAVRHTPALWPARFVDDIWMAGHLSRLGVARYVVPLGAATRPADVTRAHTLEARMHDQGLTRIQANNEALAHFRHEWNREKIWYAYSNTDQGRDAKSQHRTTWTHGALVWIREWWKQRQVDMGAGR